MVLQLSSVFLLLFGITTSLLGTHAVDLTSPEPPEEKCHLFLAPSTTSNKIFGLFSTIEIPANSSIAEPDLAIQIIGINEHINAFVEDDLTPFLLNNLWSATRTLAMYETEDDDIVSAIPGVGSLGAEQAEGVVNCEVTDMIIGIDGAEQFRDDPHAGAYTEYHNLTMISSRKILQGEEMFLNLGENYVKEADDDEMSDGEAMELANKAISQFAEFVKKYDSELNEGEQEEVWNFLKTDVLFDRKKADDMLPTNVTEVLALAASGGVKLKNHWFRTPEWLEENGVCADNLKVGTSTVPGAGRGAFAKRSLEKGSVVLLTPLVPIYDRKALDMDDGEKQLIMNYCFGHPDSSLFLFPIGLLFNYLNHKSSSDEDGPNAEIRWSTSAMGMFQKDWLDMSVTELNDEEKDFSGLFFDVVATRDVQSGEEIFLDYGKDWEEAWDEHVETWAPPEDANGYISALRMNEENAEKRFLTVEEQTENPYPSNIGTGCYHNHGVYDWEPDPRIFLGENFFPCEIQEWNKEENMYTVIVEGQEHEYHIPQKAIKFFERPHFSNQHLEEAFRHFIGITDEMFPKSWLNMGEGE